MKSFTTHSGPVAAMDRANVDTDQIIPKQFLKRIERTGFGEFLFWDWARLDDESLDPDFELNHPKHEGATVLLTRRNFGCGSSREHAPWALEDYGFRVIIAPSFADIFYNNCFKNGMLPIRLDEKVVDGLFERADKHDGYAIHVDLEDCSLRDDHDLHIVFEVEPFRRHCLINGLDDISLTLEHHEKITAYEQGVGI